jgi:hypothetical protein
MHWSVPSFSIGDEYNRGFKYPTKKNLKDRGQLVVGLYLQNEEFVGIRWRELFSSLWWGGKHSSGFHNYFRESSRHVYAEPMSFNAAASLLNDPVHIQARINYEKLTSMERSLKSVWQIRWNVTIQNLGLINFKLLFVLEKRHACGADIHPDYTSMLKSIRNCSSHGSK